MERERERERERRTEGGHGSADVRDGGGRGKAGVGRDGREHRERGKRHMFGRSGERGKLVGQRRTEMEKNHIWAERR